MTQTSAFEAIAAAADHLRRNPSRRRPVAAAAAGLILVAGAIMVLGEVQGWPEDVHLPAVLLPTLLGGLGLSVVLLSLGPPLRDYRDVLLQERTELKRRISENEPDGVQAGAGGKRESSERDIQNVIFLSLNQMEEFYELTIQQARGAFRASLWASAIGLLTVLGGIWLFYLRGEPNLTLTAISTVSGIIVQFVGVTYYFMHRRASDKMNHYYDQLLQTQDTMLAIRLASDLERPEDRTSARMSIVTTLLRKRAATPSEGVRSVPVEGSAPTRSESQPPIPATS